MNEEEKLYEEYLKLGYNQNRAIAQMRLNGYSDDAVTNMIGFYSKKKSQDSGASDSSSEAGSTESTSAGSLPQQPEVGDSASALSKEQLDELAAQFGALNYDIPGFILAGSPSETPASTLGEESGIKINAQSFLNGGDMEFNRLFGALHTHSFQNFVAQNPYVDEDFVDAHRNRFGYVPFAASYGATIDDIAMASTIDDQTREMVRDGVPLDEALRQNEELKSELGKAWEEWRMNGAGKYSRRAKALPERVFVNQRIKDIESRFNDKRDSLELEYNKFFADKFLGSLTNKGMTDRDENNDLSPASKQKLGLLESQMRRTLGVKMDLTGDKKVGNRPFLRARMIPGQGPNVMFEGDLVDAANVAALNVTNAAIHLGSKLFSSGSVMFDDSPYIDLEGNVMLGDGAYEWRSEQAMRMNEDQIKELRERMTSYQDDIIESYGSGNFANALEQSFLMTAEGWPFLIPLMFSQQLGPYGTAAVTSFMGVATEAAAIRNDFSFDKFVKNGKEYTYAEAVDEAGTADIEKILEQFELQEDNLARAGYLTAVGAGDFAIGMTSYRAFRGAYQSAQRAEMKNFLLGYAKGLGVAVPENALADWSAYVGRESTRDFATGEPEPDVNGIIYDGLNLALGRVLTTGMIYTGGRLTVTPSSKARAAEVIPMNTEKILELSRQVRTQQLRALKANNSKEAASVYNVLYRNMEKANKLYYQNEMYLEFLRKNNFDAYEQAMDALVNIDQLKAKNRLTNDPDLKIEIKSALQGEIDKLMQLHQENAKAFDEAIGLRGEGMGLREREMVREQRGISVQQAMRDAMTPLQTRPVPESPVPVGNDSPEYKARVAADTEVRTQNDWLTSNLDQMSPTTMNRGKLEEILRGGNHATLTAENPNNKVISEVENTRLNRDAREWLTSRGLEFHEILGRYDGKGERSFLVEGMTKQQAMDFARDFNQHSVLIDGGLVKADGSFLPTKGDWDIQTTVKSGDDFTSATKLEDGSSVKFNKPLAEEGTDAKGNKITDEEFFGGSEEPTPVPEAPDAAPINQEYNTSPLAAFAHRARAQVAKWWNFGVKSHGGVKQKDIEEVYRSVDRLTSRAIDDSEYDVIQVKAFVKNFKDYDAFNKFIRGEFDINNKAFKGLTEDQVGALKAMRQNVDGLSEVVIETLESLPIRNPEEAKARQQLVETIRANKGKYLHQQYEIFVDGGKRLDMLLKPRKQMPKDIREAYDEAVRYTAENEGVEGTVAEQRVRQYLMALRGEGGSVGMGGAIGAMSSPFLKSKNNRIPEPYLRLLGKIDDPVHAYLSTVRMLRQYAANARWQTELAITLQETGIGRIGSNFEGTEGAQGLYVRMAPNSAEWEPLHHMYIPKQLQDGFRNLDPLKSWSMIMGDSPQGSLASTIATAWTRAAGVSKVSKTVLSPTATNRNLTSGIFLQMANGHFFLSQPNRVFQAASQAWGNQNKKPGSSWRQERGNLIELGILNDGANSMELMKSIAEAMDKRGGRLSSDNKVWDFARKFYSFGDDFYKMSGYYIEKSRLMEYGMGDAEATAIAARRVRDGYPTYSKISKGAKALRRLPVTGSFVSFPYEMIRTTKNQFRFIAEDMKAGRSDMAIQRALGLVTSLGMADVFSEYSKDQHGLSDQDDEAIRWFGPEWQKLSKLLYLGKENGTPYFMDLSYTFPHETVMRPLRALFSYNPEDEGYMDNVSTAIDEALSAYADPDLFTGAMKEIYENKDENGRDIILVEPGSNWVNEIATDGEKATIMFNHLQKKLAPGFVGNGLEFLRSSEPVEADHPMYNMQRQFNKYFPKETRYRIYTHGDALLGMAGFRMTYLPLDYSSENKIREQVQFTADTENFFENQITKGVPISVEEAQKACDKFLRHWERSEQLISQSLVAMRKLNMTDEKIVEVLSYTGVPKKQLGLYLAGEKRVVLPITTAAIVNDAKQQLRDSRKTEEEKEKEIENIVNAVAAWNERIGQYNEQRENQD